MQLICNIPEVQPRPCAATIGFFDGVHRGHRYLIEQVREVASARGFASGVITFPMHPRKVVQPDYQPDLLTTCDEKVALLAETGLDYCMMLNFNAEIALLSAREFMLFLRDHYNIHALVIGYDHRFGHNRREGFEDYMRYGQELGVEVVLARAFIDKETAVSSSSIRQLLLEGKVSEASACLGYDYFLDGTVVSGYRVGRKIGFPTANLRVDNPDKLVPSDGVYAVHVTVEGQIYGGMLSIGYRPTMANGTNRSIEVNIFNFHSDIYEQVIRLSFVHYLRPELKFNSIDELITQLHKDAESASHFIFYA